MDIPRQTAQPQKTEKIRIGKAQPQNNQKDANQNQPTTEGGHAIIIGRIISSGDIPYYARRRKP
jgi:hypothetical protein